MMNEIWILSCHCEMGNVSRYVIAGNKAAVKRTLTEQRSWTPEQAEGLLNRVNQHPDWSRGGMMFDDPTWPDMVTVIRLPVEAFQGIGSVLMEAMR